MVHTISDLKDSQKVAFDRLLNERFPKVIKEGSASVNNCDITCEMYPLNREEIKNSEGTEFYPIKMRCTVHNKHTQETVESVIDLLNMPVLQELGFKIRGNFMQVLDSYDKMTGWTFSQKVHEGGNEITAKVSGKYGRSFSFVYGVNKKAFVDFKSSTATTRDKVPVDVFFRALSGLSDFELLEHFGHKNPFVVSFFNENADLSRNECINQVAKALMGKEQADSCSSSKLRLDKIERLLYRKVYLNLGDYNRNHFESLQSFKHRALGCTLIKPIRVDGITYEAGTVLESELLEKLDAMPISVLKVKHDGKIFELRKFSVLTFRAYGMLLAEDISRLGLKAGTELGLRELKLLNDSDLETIKVKASKSAVTKELVRRTDASTLCLDDLYTAASIWFDNLNGLDVFDKQYELTNRVCNTFDDLAANIVSNNVFKVVNSIESNILKDDVSLLNVIIDFSLDVDEFTNTVRNTKIGTGQISEMCNIVAYASKSQKIASNIDQNNANTEMISVQDSQEGRLDAYDSPESGKIGIVHHKTLLASTDESGHLTTPYFEVVNGVVSEEPKYLNALDTTGKNIAAWNETFKEDDGTPKQKIRVLCDGDVKIVDVNQVNLKEFSNIQSLSLVHSLSTFPNHSNGKRITMVCNQTRQIHDTVNIERPIVGTGLESIIDFGVYLAKDIVSTYYESHVMESKVYSEHRDEILASSITLLDITKGNQVRNFKFRINAVTKLNANRNNKLVDTTVLTVPYNMRNFEHGSFTYRLNHVPNGVYKSNDVVAHNSAYSLKDQECVSRLDFGGLDISDKDFSRGLALGKNLYCGFKTCKSRSIDDAIVISDKLLYDDSLTHKRFMMIDDVCRSGDGFSEQFGYDGSNQYDYFNYLGLPEIGTKLKAGDPIIAKIRKNMTDSFIRYTRVPDNMEGQVVAAEKVSEKGEDVARVVLVLRAGIEPGDKLAGRHGNKGVVSEIMPAEDMPYDPTLGRPLDIILSPLGVPSRQNLSQLLEVALGFCRLLEGKNRRSDVSPYYKDDLKFVLDQVEEFNAHPRKLIDGRTGEYFVRPINTGIIYFNKLQHIAADKIHAIGYKAPVDPVFQQPRKGSKNQGGQSFGEMENWCLHGIGVNKVLNDIYSFQSDDANTRNQVKKYIATHGGRMPQSITGENNNNSSMTTLLRLLGVELVSDTTNDCYELKPLTDERIRSFSLSSVDKSTLHSKSLFGDSKASSLGPSSGKHKWSWIDLGTKIVHPTWVHYGTVIKTIKLLSVYPDSSGQQKVKALGTQLMKGMINSTVFVKFALDSTNEYLACSKGGEFGLTDYYTLPEEELQDFKTGMPALVKIFELSNLRAAEIDLKSSIDFSRISQSEEVSSADLKKLKDFNELHAFNESGMTLADYVVSSFPVMPATFRPELKSKAYNNEKSSFDHYYENILIAVRNIQENNSNESIKELYNRICELTGIGIRNADEKFKNVLGYFVGKGDKDKGKLRKANQTKRVFASGRAVITPARAEISPVQLGVPVMMLVKMYIDPLAAYIREKVQCDKAVSFKVIKCLLTYVSLDNYDRFVSYYDSLNSAALMNEKASTMYKHMREWLLEFFKGDAEDGRSPQVVLAGRQPSLHKYSIRAFYPVPIWRKAIEINSLVCKGYNADFDGDQMWLHALMTEDAKEEAIAKMSPKVDFVNPKNNSVILEHSQDIVLGCYCATMLENNEVKYTQTLKDANYYCSTGMIESDIELGLLKPYDLVVFSLVGDEDVRNYISTAGRILFNDLFDRCSGFTKEPFDNPLGIEGIDCSKYYALKYDGIITSGKSGGTEPVYYSLPDICKEAYEYYTETDTASSDCIDLYYAIQKFGFKFSDYYGVSISVDDLQIENGKKEILKDVNAKRTLIEQDYQNGLISEPDMKEAILYLYTDSNEGANHKIEKTLLSNLERNNNLFIMMDSGARGNKTQIMHMCGAIGVLEKNKLESMSDSITSNYFEGLDTFDVDMASYSSRTGVASTQRETRDAGYSTRKVVYITDNFKVLEHDCGKTDWWYDVVWDDPISDLARFYPTDVWISKYLGDATFESCTEDISLAEGEAFTTEALELLKTKGFNSLSVNYSDGTIQMFSATPEILIGSVISESDKDTSKKFAHLLSENGEFTKAGVAAFENYKLTRISTNFGVLEMRYKMHDACRSELLQRIGRNMKYLKKVYDKGYQEFVEVITDKTLDWVEQTGKSRIEARVMLDCKTEHGVCAHCYGLKYSNGRLPAKGELVGTEAAQAIGEPAAQLTMNVINKGGVAGASLSSGIQLFNAYLDGNTVGGKSARVADIAKHSGYVKIQKFDDAVTVSVEPLNKNCSMCAECLKDCEKTNGLTECPMKVRSFENHCQCVLDKKIPKAALNVVNGQFIPSGSAITNYPMISDNVYSVDDNTDPAVVLRRKQMIWIFNYFGVFKDNGIEINARHFEILSMIQNGYATVTSADTNSEYEVGELYSVRELVKDPSVKFSMNTLNKQEAMLHDAGLLTALTFADQGRLVARATMHNIQSSFEYNTSQIGKISVGQDLESDVMKILDSPIVYNGGYGKDLDVTGNITPELLDAKNSSGLDSSAMDIFGDSYGFDFSLESTEEVAEPEVALEIESEAVPEVTSEEPNTEKSTNTMVEFTIQALVDGKHVPELDQDFLVPDDSLVEFDMSKAKGYKLAEDEFTEFVVSEFSAEINLVKDSTVSEEESDEVSTKINDSEVSSEVKETDILSLF